jgi:hypothetical protein
LLAAWAWYWGGLKASAFGQFP